MMQLHMRTHTGEKPFKLVYYLFIFSKVSVYYLFIFNKVSVY